MEWIVRCGNYRHFIVTADSEKQARERFDKESENALATNGFMLKDVTSIELKEE